VEAELFDLGVLAPLTVNVEVTPIERKYLTTDSARAFDNERSFAELPDF
jgi:hypothetical protein